MVARDEGDASSDGGVGRKDCDCELIFEVPPALFSELYRWLALDEKRPSSRLRVRLATTSCRR